MYQRTQQPDPQYLQWELERYQQEEQRRQEEEEQQRQQRQKERDEAREYERRTAETWPEALLKQINLMQEEADYEQEDEEQNGTYFTDAVNACRRALDIWPKIQMTKQARIEELQRQIETIEDEIRQEVAQQLYKESNRLGWHTIADSIKKNIDLNNFLYW